MLYTISTKRKVLMYLLHCMGVCLFFFTWSTLSKAGMFDFGETNPQTDVRNRPRNKPAKHTPLGHIPGWARRSENTTWLHAHVNTHPHTHAHILYQLIRDGDTFEWAQELLSGPFLAVRFGDFCGGAAAGVSVFWLR